MTEGKSATPVERLRAMLEKGENTEQAYQDLIEQNPELFPLPYSLNHDIQFGLISKFPLDTSLITDLTYMTKSTVERWVVLVEFESPDKQLFRADDKPHSDFQAAIDQVRDWRLFLDANRQEVLRRLRPLMEPSPDLHVTFKYALVIGRSSEYENNTTRKNKIRDLQNEHLKIWTYDTILRQVEAKPARTTCVFSLQGQAFKFKYLHDSPGHVFAWVKPEHLKLDPPQKDRLLELGYEINQWEAGEFLSVNCKYTSATGHKRMTDSMKALAFKNKANQNE